MEDHEGIKHFELNGREYVFHKMPSTKAVRLITRLGKLFGDPLLRLLLGAGGKMVKIEEVSPVELDTLATKLQFFERLNDDDLVELERMVFPYVWLNKQRIFAGMDTDLDTKFDGYELDSLTVLWEAVKFNLSPFFSAISSRSPAAFTMTESS
jgi:hypothetical protein